MDKETDPRIKELLTTWSDFLWKGKYGYGYPVNWARDAKLMQRLLGWMDKSIPDKDGAKNTLLQAMGNYLNEPSGFYADEKHPFGKFAASPQKWLDLAPKRPIPAKTYGPPPPDPKTPDEVFESFCEYAIKDPIKAMKGFAWTYNVLKKRNPELYAKVRTYLLELLGKDRAVSIFNESKKSHDENALKFKLSHEDLLMSESTGIR